MKKNIFVVFMIFEMISSIASAKPNKKLVEYFQNQLSSLNQPMMGSEGISGMPEGQAEMWYLNQFSLRLRAAIGFEVEGLTSFLVVPETELIWQRGNPSGWNTYSL